MMNFIFFICLAFPILFSVVCRSAAVTLECFLAHLFLSDNGNIKWILARKNYGLAFEKTYPHSKAVD